MLQINQKSSFQVMEQSNVGSNPNIMNFELLRTWQVELWTHSNPGLSTKTELLTYLNLFKKPNNFEPVQPETSRTKTQIWKNQTLNHSKLRFVYQNQTMNPPEPRTHELGLTQHYSKPSENFFKSYNKCFLMQFPLFV